MKCSLAFLSVILLSIGSLTARQSTKATAFEFIEPAADVSSLRFIATIHATGTGKESSVPRLFFKLKMKAKELGANCFALGSYEKSDSAQKTTLALTIYSGSEAVLEANRDRHLKNKGILFLDDLNSGEEYSFYINKIEKKIKSGECLRYTLKKGVDFEISQTGLFGSSRKLPPWKENGPAFFITFTDYGLENKKGEAEYLGMYFNTKRINMIDRDLGYLLDSITK